MALLTVNLSGAGWPGFGGPGGDFTVPAATGTIEAAPTVLWSRELGFGNSGIVESDGQLFTLYRELDSTGAANESETIIAVDADNGETLWSHSYLERALEGQNDYGGGRGPHATPFVTEELVFTLGYAGSLHCRQRATGEVVWQISLVDDLGAEPVQFGFSASPIVVDGKLIVNAGGRDGGLFALDPATGRMLWRSTPAGPSYATPVLVELAGERQLIYASQNFVQGIRLEDGAVRWRHDLPKKELTNVPTPLPVDGDRIFIAGQGVGGAALIKVTRNESGFQVEELWRLTRVNFFHNSFIQQGGMVYGGSSFLYGIRLEDGERVWSERGYDLANVVGLGDRALLATQDGRITLVKLSLDGVENLGFTDVFDAEAWTPPTVVGNRVYARDREAMVSLSLSGEPVQLDAPDYLRDKRRLVELAEAGAEQPIVDLISAWSAADRPVPGIPAQLRASQALFDSGDTIAAAALLRALLVVHPESVVALGKLARLSLTEGDRPAAREAYAAALRLDSDFNEGRRMLEQLEDDPAVDGNVTFTLKQFSDARLVTLAGSFNGWNPFHTLMRPTESGWTTTLQLPPGEYEYKFVVDGNWTLDPGNPRKRSGQDNNVNSLLTVE